jgi:hypothetical protein
MATPQPARIVGADPIGRSAPKCCFVRVLIRVSQPVIWALKLPAIAPAERQEEVSKLEGTIARRSAKVDRLTALAGDREQAIDEHGWLPAERREAMRWKWGP